MAVPTIAGQVWTEGNHFHYSDETGPIERVIAGGFACSIDCSGHDQAEDADVNVSVDVGDNDVVQILNLTDAEIGNHTSEDSPHEAVAQSDEKYDHNIGADTGDDSGANNDVDTSVDGDHDSTDNPAVCTAVQTDEKAVHYIGAEVSNDGVIYASVDTSVDNGLDTSFYPGYQDSYNHVNLAGV